VKVDADLFAAAADAQRRERVQVSAEQLAETVDLIRSNLPA